MLTKILNRGANALKNALRGIDFGKLQTSACVSGDIIQWRDYYGHVRGEPSEILGFYLKMLAQFNSLIFRTENQSNSFQNLFAYIRCAKFRTTTFCDFSSFRKIVNVKFI